MSLIDLTVASGDSTLSVRRISVHEGISKLFTGHTVGEGWQLFGRAAFASDPYRPEIVTSKPRVHGVQSAMVVGPKGQEIHTDELCSSLEPSRSQGNCTPTRPNPTDAEEAQPKDSSS